MLHLLALLCLMMVPEMVSAQCGNEGGSGPCHQPPWPATWQMNASTIIMPCNYTGYQVPKTVADWGIVDFDWSNNLAGGLGDDANLACLPDEG